jgi:hypothetical protein
MKRSTLPFFAGQHRQERLGARTVFSPLPVMTNVPPVRRTDWLTKKHPHYIELGGRVALSFKHKSCICFGSWDWSFLLHSFGDPREMA